MDAEYLQWIGLKLIQTATIADGATQAIACQLDGIVIDIIVVLW
jgi:hypothetical protein